MKILLHNMLRCKKDSCKTGGYPLTIVQADEVEESETQGTAKGLAKTLETRVDWPVLVAVARQFGWAELPEEFDEQRLQEEEFVQVVHGVLYRKVVEGKLK
mmetsp:Transcript_11990/g.13628  ORF Transcript_11990/g.13628 Transcript_11990/m.13628 type:complete len:101 (+) Transcript_11990:35-337(+)